MLSLPFYPCFVVVGVAQFFEIYLPVRRYAVFRVRKPERLRWATVERTKLKHGKFVVPLEGIIDDQPRQGDVLMPVANAHGINVPAYLCLVAANLNDAAHNGADGSDYPVAST